MSEKSKAQKPYQVDDTIYKRYDFRKALNPMMMGAVGNTMLERTRKKAKGFSRMGLAFQEGAWTLQNAFGTDSLFGDEGLYSWQPLEHTGTHGAPDFPKELGKWDFKADNYTTQQVSQAVKTVAKFYGASLVGIANVDQRWFYSKSIYMQMSKLMSGAVDLAAEQGIEIPVFGTPSGRDVILKALQSMENKKMKDFVIHTLEVADPSILQQGMSAAAGRMMPATVLHSMLPTVVPTFSKEYLHLIATEMDPAYLPADFDPNSILQEDIQVADISETMPAGDIVFADVDQPSNDREKHIQVIPNTMKYVIVMAFEMDETGLSLKHSTESAGAISHGYSRMAFAGVCLAQFIRNLGYNAIPMGNDTGLSVPMAIDAGLGELSRAGYLITKKYGPRVRLSKVITDLPLEPDTPITFGVTEFCEVCGKCAKRCPAKAISTGPRSFETPPTGNPGVLKWAADGAKCIKYWADSGTGCSQCIVACPFNKSQGWIHDVTRSMINMRSGLLDKLFLKLDDAFGYGKPKDTELFWEKKTFLHIRN
jgi:reductive dehalogenase